LDSLLADHGATYEHKVISVEHVLPQTAASDSIWLTWFPDPEKRESWTHKLANLVLLSRQKNTQAELRLRLEEARVFPEKGGWRHSL
jgi:hypothetical protein